MSDNDNQIDEELRSFADEQMPKPPPTDVTAPDIAPVIKKTGRHFRDCPCQRCIQGFGPVADRPPLKGRQSGPRKPSTPNLQRELDKRLPQGAELMTDANVGKAIAGAFAAIGIFRGGHWRLFAAEEAELGAAFGPLARMYGPEELGKWITVLMVVPVVTGILMPRIAVEREIMAGRTAKDGGREQLLQIKSYVEAEKYLDIAQQVRESQAVAEASAALKARIRMTTEVAGEMKAAQFDAEGVTNAQS